MAVVRPSRSAPPIALITFVFLTLVATGLAIFFGLQMSSANQELAELKDISKDAALPADKALVSEAIRGTPNVPAVRAQAKQIEVLKELLAGAVARRQSVDELRDAAVKAYKAASATNLMGAVSTQTEKLTKLQSELDAMKSQNATYSDQLKGLRAPFDASETTLRGQITKLTQDIADKNAEISAVKDEMKGALEKAQKDADDRARDADAEIRKAANERAVLQARIEYLTKELKELREPPIKGDRHPILWQADGRVIRTPIGSKEVWINIGRKDRLNTNTTFSIYDPKLGVGSGPDSRGRGALEVIQVGETESLCRITHTEPGESIMEGDMIANIVFNRGGAAVEGNFKRDRAKVYTFYVFGDFDLDGDGISTPSERDHIIRQIQAWGGEVVDKVDTQCDFLVLGAQPAGDASVILDAASTQPGSELETQKKAQREQYIRLLLAAKDYAIPVLDANRFFAYIGYYNNTVVGRK